MSALALFDFDGTLCRKDSYLLFLKHTFSASKRVSRLIRLAPTYLGYRLGWIPPAAWKTRLWSTFFSGWARSDLEEQVHRFLPALELSYLYPTMLERMKWHLQAHHEVAIVTANFEPLLKPWADAWHIQLLASQPECVDGRFTGKLVGKPCTGAEKINRVRQTYRLTDFTEIFAYGNSREDKPMQSIATHAFYRTFEFSDK